MGISNRDYYRDTPPPGDFGGGGGRALAGPAMWGIKGILIVCVGVFFLQNAFASNNHITSGFVEWLRLDWQSLKSFQLWRLVTYGFVHGSIEHLFFNMFGLWMLGRLTEGIYGSREFTGFFIAGVVVSGLVQVGFSETVRFFRDDPFPSAGIIGASGGVVGVVILAAMHFPRQPMHFLFVPVAIELRWLAAIYVAIDTMMAISNLQSQHHDGVAHLAHLVGAAWGFFYVRLGIRVMPGSRSLGRPSSGGLFRKVFSKRKKRPKPVSNVRLYEPPAEQDLDREVDRILDKINLQGRDSLTPDEERVLMKASEKYQQRETST